MVINYQPQLVSLPDFRDPSTVRSCHHVIGVIGSHIQNSPEIAPPLMYRDITRSPGGFPQKKTAGNYLVDGMGKNLCGFFHPSDCTKKWMTLELQVEKTQLHDGVC